MRHPRLRTPAEKNRRQRCLLSALDSGSRTWRAVSAAVFYQVSLRRLTGSGEAFAARSMVTQTACRICGVFCESQRDKADLGDRFRFDCEDRRRSERQTSSAMPSRRTAGFQGQACQEPQRRKPRRRTWLANCVDRQGVDFPGSQPSGGVKDGWFSRKRSATRGETTALMTG